MMTPFTTAFLFALFVIWQGAVSRAAGGGLYASRVPSPVPEILFGIPFGYACALLHPAGITLPAIDLWLFTAPAIHISPAIIGVTTAIWSYLAMEQGHGNAMHDGVAQFDFADRRQGLDVIVRPLCAALHILTFKRVDFSPRSMWYCRVFMGIKGALIAAPLGPWSAMLAVLWPMAYAVCFQNQIAIIPQQRNSAFAEWFAGMFAGMTILCALAGYIAAHA